MKKYEQWFSDSLDGSLGPAEQAELMAWMRAAPENMRLFVEFRIFDQQIRQVVHAKAQREAAECFEAGVPLDPELRTRRPSRLSVVRPWIIGMGAAALLTLFVQYQSQRLVSPSSDSFASIVSTRGTQAVRDDKSYTPGQDLTAGIIALSAGTMELLLNKGVKMIFEGPGELNLVNPMHAVLTGGQVVVQVSENAHGFRLETPVADVIDLGTEFATKVSANLVTDVQVFDGMVVTTSKAASSSGFPQQINAGKALRFDPAKGSAPGPLAYAPDRFIGKLTVSPPIEHDSSREFPFNRARYEEIVVLPTNSVPVIDGDLSDWSADGAFRSEREGPNSGVYHIEGRMRYDKDFLYVAAHIGDPYPMRNIVDPATDPEFAWRGGGLQIRLAADTDLGWPVEAHSPAY
jgi:ferric-dicitrate binding protein FerR (iron transport regulator)